MCDTYRVSQDDYLYRRLPWGIQTHQWSQDRLVLPFHQGFYVRQLEKHKKASVVRASPARPALHLHPQDISKEVHRLEAVPHFEYEMQSSTSGHDSHRED
ncbi:hypothetical protein U0070_001758 [Myodes glareolus]|uniref:Uncharacterized protein n=1 Tax=Myodes glareolus TaxID=447135 RepID=A0AAW0HPW2_MYOGA